MTDVAVEGRVLPAIDEVSRPFWDAAAGHRLAIARCARCDAFSHPPDITCPNCHSAEPDWSFEAVPGDGRLRTWTVIRQSFLPGMAVPFVLADVQLDALPHIRLIGQLLDWRDADPVLGEAVTMRFEDLAAGIAVPAFVRAARP